METDDAVWGVKEGDTYHDGDRMVAGSQNHSPHYHFLHYAETDPLMDHTRGSNKCHTRSESHQKSIDQRANGKEGGLAVAYFGWVRGSTQEHSKQNTQKQSTLRRAKTGF